MKFKPLDGSSFEAMDLCEESVHRVYLDCQPSKGTEKVYSVVLYMKNLGYKEDSAPIYLDAEKIDANSHKLLYLAGQLQMVHREDPDLLPKKLVFKYDGTVWTRSPGIVMEFLVMLRAASMATPFVPPDNDARILIPYPSFSPNDPRFSTEYPAWIKDHNALVVRLEEISRDSSCR